jgi:hypothetical protein
MTINELIGYAESRLTTLNQMRNTAVQQGNLDFIARIDDEIAQTEGTLVKLRSL